MWCGWILGAAPHFCLQFVFLLRSLGIALFRNGKDYWFSKAVCAIYFQTVGKASVIISILTLCCTRIRDILVCCTSARSRCIQQVSTNQMIAYELLGVSMLNDRCEDSSSRDWFPILGRMCCGWIVEAAPHFRLQFVFLLRSLGVALF